MKYLVRFVVLKCALEWMKKIPVSVGDEENNVQLDLYLTALQEGFNIQVYYVSYIL